MKKFKRLTIIFLISLTVLSGCSLPGLNNTTRSDDDVTITAVVTTESQIMAHMLRLLIEHDTNGKIKPNLINNLGSSTIQHIAIIGDQANMSGARYTGTDLSGVLQEDPIKDPDKAMVATKKGFEEKFNQTYFDSYGFENTYALMVTQETAKKYNLETVSDLEKHADELRVGMDTDWMNKPGDGYPAFRETYGFEFGTARPMQIGLVYDALSNGSLDVAVGYSTDGRIADYNLKILEDDKRFFPPYDASPLATDEILEAHPELRPIIKKLEGKITTEEMQRLNYEADGEGQEPATVAENFLKEHNYFEDDKGGQK